jgi:hypothetical protein
MDSFILFILCVKLVKQIFTIQFIWSNRGFYYFHVDSALSPQFIVAFSKQRVCLTSKYILTHCRQLVDLIPSLKAINVACCGFSGLNYRTCPWAPHSDKRIRVSSY